MVIIKLDTIDNKQGGIIMPETLIKNIADYSAIDLWRIRPRIEPERLLMCPPTFFEVVDIKNYFMRGQIGKVDKAKAQDQWQLYYELLCSLGLNIDLIEPIKGLEDMTFTANSGVVWQEPEQSPRFLASNMLHPKRQFETRFFVNWFRQNGHKVEKLSNPNIFFEGGGDAVWYPDKMLLFGGYGQRTEIKAYSEMNRRWNIPIVLLELVSEEFYHLDTCFCILDSDTVLFCPEAFSYNGVCLIESIFSNKIELSKEQAKNFFAGNCFVPKPRTVVLQKGDNITTTRLKNEGFNVIPIDLSEFIKSGGNATCLKLNIY